MSREEFATMGEALVRRELKKHRRAGVDHFVAGQHGAFVEDGIAYVTFVDQMGHAVNIPFERDGDDWKPVGVYQRAGQATAEQRSLLPEDFVPTEKMRAELWSIDLALRDPNP
jgi:hypothetical protein